MNEDQSKADKSEGNFNDPREKGFTHDSRIAEEAANLINNQLERIREKEGEASAKEGIRGNVDKYTPMAEEAARSLGEAQMDSVTGLLHSQVAIKVMKEKLKKGLRGSLLVLDLVALKHFNSFAHRHGDTALRVVAESLEEYGFSTIGRKGDEFYAFAADVDPTKLKEGFSQHLKEKDRKKQMQVVVSEDESLQVSVFWRCGEVNAANFDDKLDRLDDEVESQKTRVREQLISGLRHRHYKSDLEKLNYKLLYFHVRLRAENRELTFLLEDQDKYLLASQYGVEEVEDINVKEIIKKIPIEHKKGFDKLLARAVEEVVEKWES